MRRWMTLALVGLMTSCARNDEPTGEVTLTHARAEVTRFSDDQLATAIEQRLGRKPALAMATRDVSIAIDNGAVTVRGAVPSAAVKDAVTVIADTMAGVHGFSNELRVEPSAVISDADSDGVIDRAIDRALRADEETRSFASGIRAESSHGVVTLRGRVPTKTDRRAVVALAQAMPGVVVALDDELVVASSER